MSALSRHPRPAAAALSILLAAAALALANLAAAQSPAQDSLRLLEGAPPRPGELTVTAIGEGGRWSYRFQSDDAQVEIRPSSAKTWLQPPLVLPAHRRIRIQATATDGLYRFTPPGGDLTLDALPGRLAEGWFETGPPRQTSQICIADCNRTNTSIVVRLRVVEDDAFNAYLDGLKAR